MKDYELLEAQARMMRMAEKHCIDDWRKLVKVSNYEITGYIYLRDTRGDHDSRWPFYRFAIGVVEGKPVFEGDTLYDQSGTAYVASMPRDAELKWLTDPQEPMLYGERNGTMYFCQLKNAVTFSWNPPKPKTVMVELLVEDAEMLQQYVSWCKEENRMRVNEACRKALGVLK